MVNLEQTFLNAINEMKINYYTDLLSDLILYYYQNKKEFTKKDILSELSGVRELKKTEVDTIYNTAIENAKTRYNTNF